MGVDDWLVLLTKEKEHTAQETSQKQTLTTQILNTLRTRADELDQTAWMYEENEVLK